VGEAKRKEERLRAALLVECDLWDRPGSAWEAQLVEEIGQLEIVAAERAPADQLEWGGMQPRECHANSIFYSRNDPTGASKHVLGWWVQGDLLVLHSVIENDGRYICITPQESDVPAVFPFIPDPAIEAREEGDHLEYYRNGQPITAGLRQDPVAHRASIVLMRERLLGGMKPWRAMHLIDDEACERLGVPKPPRR
jgi:hypothetical protein